MWEHSLFRTSTLNFESAVPHEAQLPRPVSGVHEHQQQKPGRFQSTRPTPCRWLRDKLTGTRPDRVRNKRTDVRPGCMTYLAQVSTHPRHVHHVPQESDKHRNGARVPMPSAVKSNRAKTQRNKDCQETDWMCEGCLVVGCDHGPQAEVAQGVGPGPLVER